MKDLSALITALREHRPVPWEQLPDFSLYMDQVLSYMDRQVLRFDGDDGLTAAMVNNYTKNGLAPRAESKKYNREHLAYFTAICILKRVMPSKDIDLLTRALFGGPDGVQAGYGAFCDSLDQAMDLTAGQLEEPGERSLADEAVRFALLSYAAGVASSRCVAMLRAQEAGEDPGEKKGKRGKERGL